MASHLDDEHLHRLLLFLIFSSMLISCRTFAATQTASDILNKGVNITDGKTLVSAGGSFTLGFFAPDVPTRRYLGIWFSMTNASDAVCWVANRDRPLGDTSGVLMVTDTGNLVLLDGSGQTAWSSNTTGGAASPTVQLLESGNLVVRDTSSGTMVWQSFDHPSNTLLPGMKIGRNLWTGAEWSLLSWRAANDPSPGTYRYMIVKNRLLENVMVDSDGNVRYRTGVWNGLWFSGIPEMATYSDMYAYHMTISISEITYGYTAKAGAPYSRLVLLDTGVVQRLVWDSKTQEWKNFFQGPRDVCDAYAKCGPFGLCDASAASTSFCSCVQGFSPVSPSDWYMRDTSRGCRRNVPLNCSDSKKSTSTDGFVTVLGVKLPDTLNSSMDTSITLDECRARCLANCSCVAYAAADIQGGGAGTGCIIWTDSITDLRYVDGGQALYLRLANSELGPAGGKGNKKLVVILASTFSAMALIILLILLVFLIWTGRLDWRHIIRWCLALDLMATIQRATGNFSITNVRGEGAFGIVYEGNLSRLHRLVHGLPETIAVKRLKPDLPEIIINYFTREVQLMAAALRLQHPNVLQFLDYCSEGTEKILVYEYMHRGSLESYIFGERARRELLNWQRRLQIFLGIAQGVNHLHEGPGELDVVILHRDLKPANVLLDDEWNAKVADFGTAKLLFAGAEGAHTIIGTPGYMAPEYVLDEDQTTLKCDVYSFGVTLLETLAGRRNSMGPENLISSAWRLWEDINRDIVDLLDDKIPADHELIPELRRCIHIGLLCIQREPDDRPSMSEVVEMLNNRDANLARPMSPMVELPELREADNAVPIDYAAVSDANLRWQYARPRAVPRIDMAMAM